MPSQVIGEANILSYVLAAALAKSHMVLPGGKVSSLGGTVAGKSRSDFRSNSRKAIRDQ